jgi:hypothetical protein
VEYRPWQIYSASFSQSRKLNQHVASSGSIFYSSKWSFGSTQVFSLKQVTPVMPNILHSPAYLYTLIIIMNFNLNSINFRPMFLNSQHSVLTIRWSRKLWRLSESEEIVQSCFLALLSIGTCTPRAQFSMYCCQIMRGQKETLTAVTWWKLEPCSVSLPVACITIYQWQFLSVRYEALY